MRLYHEVLQEYQTEDDFVHLGNPPAPPTREALKAKISQVIADFQFTDNFYYEKEFLLVLLAARQALEAPGTKKFIGARTLSTRFETSERVCKIPPGIESLVRQAILCNIIEDENDRKRDRKDLGAELDLSTQVNDRFETYLLNEAKKMAIRVRSLQGKKDERKSNPLKINLLKAANALLDNDPPHGYTAENLAAYNYALDQFKPELREHRGKTQSKGMLSFMRDRTEDLLDDIEKLVHKMESHSPVNAPVYSIAYQQAMTKDLQTQVQGMLVTSHGESTMKLLQAALLLLNNFTDMHKGNYLYCLSEHKRLNKPLLGQLFSDKPIFEEKTEALIRKMESLIRAKEDTAGKLSPQGRSGGY